MQLIDTGQYVFRLVSAPKHLLKQVESFYCRSVHSDEVPADFRVSLRFDSLIRRYFFPQVTFYSDCSAPFKPVPLGHSFAILEWGMNWCIAAHEYTRLLVHASVLVKNEKALIFPAEPGSGKSTLTAYLALSGWKLFSDEMAIISLDDLRVSPLYRPICLKNDSIDLVKRWFPDVQMSAISKDTQKGDVAHIKAIERPEYENLKPVAVVGVVFPKYKSNAQLSIYSLSQIQSFRQLSENSFNYSMLGDQGFQTVAEIIKTTRQLELHYSDLKDVKDFLEEEFMCARTHL